MAKLENIQYGRAAVAQTMSPGAVVNANSSKYSAFGRTLDALGKVAEKYTEDPANIAVAHHRQVGIDTMKYTAENETLTWDELEQLGIADKIDVKNIDGSQMKDVPRHLWSATLLESELETSREVYGATLKSKIEREAWARDMGVTDSRAVLSSVEAAATEAKNRLGTQLSNHRKAAIEEGDWDLAAQIQDLGIYKDTYASTPGLRDLHKLEVAQGREFDGFDMMMMAGDYDEVMDLASDSERDTALSSEDLRKVYFSAQTTQDQAETENAKLEKQFKEASFVEALSGITAGDVSMQEVLDTRKSYTPAHFSQLINAANAAIDGSASVKAAHANATENNFITNLDMASRGVYPEGIETLAEYQEWARTNLYANITRYEPDGSMTPGLDSGATTRLLKQVTDLEEIPYTSRGYKNLVTEMKLRILRSDDTGPSWLAQADTAQLMAGAVDDLHHYMDTALAEGKQPNLVTWEQENMPKFMLQGARAALIKLPKDLQSFVVYDGAKVSYDGTLKGLQQKRDTALANNPGMDMSTMDRLITQFGDYWDTYGEAYGVQN